MKTIILIFVLLPNMVFANEAGEEFHEESCVACHLVRHDEVFYTRQTRKITTLPALKGQVSRCSQAFSVGWFPDEEDSVIDYLNQQYYQFK